MAKIRTFGELKKGGTFWVAVAGSITKRRASRIFDSFTNEGMMYLHVSWRVGCYLVDKNATKYEDDKKFIYCYTSKKDAQKKALELLEKQIKEEEDIIESLKEKREVLLATIKL